MKRIVFCFFCFCSFGLFAQNTNELPDTVAVAVVDDVEAVRDNFRIAFYNLENLYDTFNDTTKNDEQFLPEGDKHWTPDKYKEKQNHMSKVMVAIGGWNPAAIIGVCEVENRKVLDDLIKNTPLSSLNYQYVHYDSPDARGVDVAMLYRPDDFKVLYSKPFPPNFPEGKRTRDILYVKGMTSFGDTLHVFINHWPSKFGGEMESEPRRLFVGEFLKHITDSLFKINPRANIVIVGDLNDGPESSSVQESLGAKIKFDNYVSNALYNLTYNAYKKHGVGSHKFQGEWSIIDNIIVSGSLLDFKNTMYTTPDEAHVFNAPFLLEKDDRNYGYMPFRTYVGFTYHGGFADHLPVYFDIWKTKNK